MRTWACLLWPALLAGQVAKIEVADTAGLRRFGYPVRARVKTEAPSETLRLVADGKPVDAQFTRLDGGETEVDFTVSLGPWEKRWFTVEKGAPRPVAAAMRVEESPDAYAVRYPSGLTFHVPKDLHGLLRSVETAGTEYVAPGSAGLIAGGSPALATASRVVKSGPLACALEFDILRPMKSVVRMEFPRSKSWVEVRWTAETPDRLTAGINLSVEGKPPIVDFGASTMVYATVNRGQSARMQSTGRGWTIDVNGQAYAAAPHGRPEGWAHAMDSRRATAIAVADFAGAGSAIEISSDGRLRIERNAPLRFWLHFVSMPVQVGAATSPQSMMRPPGVRVE